MTRRLRRHLQNLIPNPAVDAPLKQLDKPVGRDLCLVSHPFRRKKRKGWGTEAYSKGQIFLVDVELFSDAEGNNTSGNLYL